MSECFCAVRSLCTDFSENFQRPAHPPLSATQEAEGDHPGHKDAVLTAQALANFEAFYALPRGTATEDQVATSSAGIQGWAAADRDAELVEEVDLLPLPVQALSNDQKVISRFSVSLSLSVSLSVSLSL